jgi:hypothetical protein
MPIIDTSIRFACHHLDTGLINGRGSAPGSSQWTQSRTWPVTVSDAPRESLTHNLDGLTAHKSATAAVVKRVAAAYVQTRLDSVAIVKRRICARRHVAEQATDDAGRAAQGLQLLELPARAHAGQDARSESASQR